MFFKKLLETVYQILQIEINVTLAVNNLCKHNIDNYYFIGDVWKNIWFDFWNLQDAVVFMVAGSKRPTNVH